jgi:hypothetical protein
MQRTVRAAGSGVVAPQPLDAGAVERVAVVSPTG